jgi:hypothetical protein
MVQGGVLLNGGVAGAKSVLISKTVPETFCGETPGHVDA